MHSWNMGYDTDTNYEYKYFQALNPYRLRFNFLSQGLAFPKLGPNSNACELGFGNGLSVVMHAAATPVHWYGNDFNPSQVEYARLLAEKGSIGVELSDDAFDQFLAREDLPMFDYICLHGIWSWISPENQDVIVDFIKRKLKVGGIVYISYNVTAVNCMVEPFRYLLKQYIAIKGQPGLNQVQNTPAGLEFLNQLTKIHPQYLKQTPSSLPFFHKKFLQRDANYICHEYLNDNWCLEHFHQVANKLERAKLSYVCQANFLANIDEYNFTAQERQLLQEQKTSELYEQLYDLFGNFSFRSDVYSKGLVKLSPKLQQQELDETYFILMKNPSDTKFTFTTRTGTYKINYQRVAPLIKLMSDLKPHSYYELRQALSSDAQNLSFATFHYQQSAARDTVAARAAVPVTSVGATDKASATTSVAVGTSAMAQGAALGSTKGSAGECLTPLNEQEFFDLVIYAYMADIIAITLNPQTIEPDAIERCRKLNSHLLANREHQAITTLVSPLLGEGVYTDVFALELIEHYLKQPNLSLEQMVAIIKELYLKQLNTAKDQPNQEDSLSDDPLLRDPQAVDSAAQVIAQEFISFNIPLYKSLLII